MELKLEEQPLGDENHHVTESKEPFKSRINSRGGKTILHQSELELKQYSRLPAYFNIIFLVFAASVYIFCSYTDVSLRSLIQSGSISRSRPSIVPTFENDETNKPIRDDLGSVVGPLITSNFADPAIIVVKGVSYAFATNNRGQDPDLVHVQVATSEDNRTWTLLKHDPLPKAGAWATGARVWAPDVVELDNGTFVMYYSDEPKFAPAHHCVGAATSSQILGPYTPIDTPLSCPDVHTLGGAIDPDGFQDPSTGKRYITYKVDGNSLGHGGACVNTIPPIVPTPIMLQEVSSGDGVTRVGNAIRILDRDILDGPLIEAPSLQRSDDGVYFLFFSSNCFTTPMYDINYATALDIRGPYTKASRPLLVTGDVPGLVAPGGMDIVRNGNTIVFHGHITGNKDSNLSDEAEREQRTEKPSQVVPPALIRGMYSAVVTFNGTIASLKKGR